MNLLYSPSQRRGIFFLLIIFISYFIYLFFERNSKENISPIVVVVESESIKTLEIEKPLIIPKNRNPNFWKRKDWDQLGFSNTQIKIIQNYQKKLNIFSAKKQLLKCYAFNEMETKMLDSIVVIPEKTTKSEFKKSFVFLLSSEIPNYDLKNYFDTIYYNKSSNGVFRYYVSNSKKNNFLAIKNFLNGEKTTVHSLNPRNLRMILSTSHKKNHKSKILKKSKFIVNINLADSLNWRKLRGVGTKRSIHILNYKNALGGFVSIYQVNEVFSINDSLFKSFERFLNIKDSSLATININTCTVKQLKNHPYINWNIANSIVNFREQHGVFKLLEDLKKIHILDNKLYYKIVPYLSIM
ncbi:helix-hairpin-helix domain-containing protein [Flavobacteriales bacterium]|nr:helix-hairpin-helix domain-containing protein [Flavobacteriales bacterium]